MKNDLPDNYHLIVNSLKERIRKARLQATFRLNTDLLMIYREIGLAIAQQEQQAGWGAKVVEKLSKDLQSEFNDMRGLSARNLRYMRDFALAYPHFPFLQGELAKSKEIDSGKGDNHFLQGELAKLSWYHHITLLDKVKEPGARKFYIEQAVLYGWTRDIMVNQIESGAHLRQGQLSNNFSTTTDDSELVRQVFKDPYKLEFISLGKEAKERDLEDALTNQLMKFLLELGQFFSFLGRQYKVTLGDNDYYYDLLFYHTKLKRYIIIELKIGDFKPEFVGKMSFYLSVADDTLRDQKDEKSIGLILCKTKDGLVAEYALRDANKPIGISEYKLHEKLPDSIQGELPSIEEIEQNIEGELKVLQTISQARMGKLMQRLATFQQEEVQTPATYQILYELFGISIRPLFEYLLDRMKEFDEYFLESSYFWNFQKNTSDILEFEKIWKDEHLLRSNMEGYFQYRLSGFKKAGVDAFDITSQLVFRLDQYQYGFRLSNDPQPLIRKMYGQHLTKADMLLIGDEICQKLVDHIEWQIDRISQLLGTKPEVKTPDK